MKDTTRKIFEKSQWDYMCPICQKSFHLEEPGSLRCGSGHSFDISARGYINFIPNLKSEKYSRELFESRQAVFGDGFYAPVAEAVCLEIVEYARDLDQVCVLDAGCGEGYYALRLERDAALAGRLQTFAIDIVKDAILLAARKESHVNWIVADLTQIPLKRKKVDVLLNILTPANYTEFDRVLKDEGLFIKVIPAEHYLREVRQAAAGQLNNKTYSNQDVVDYFSSHMELVKRQVLQYQMPVSKEQFDHFLKMTPMTFGVDLSRLEVEYPEQITIHMELLLGRKKAASENPQTNGNSEVVGEKPQKNRKRHQKGKKPPSGSTAGSNIHKKKKRAKR